MKTLRSVGNHSLALSTFCAQCHHDGRMPSDRLAGAARARHIETIGPSPP